MWGRRHKAFTLDQLRDPFRVFTRWESVYDSGRYYAFVVPGSGSANQEYLCERLVRAGLVRIHTKGETTPDGTSFHAFKDRLKGLEAEAKARWYRRMGIVIARIGSGG